MRHVHVDVTHRLIALADRDHFLGRLNEENRLHNAVDSDGNSGRPAARSARIHGKSRIGELVGFLEAIFREWRQIGIAEVGIRKGRLLAGIIGDKRP